MDWNPSFAAQLGQATDMVRSGRLAEATQAIQQALAGHTGAAAAPFYSAPGYAAATVAPMAPVAPATGAAPSRAPQSAWRSAGAAAEVEDAVVRAVYLHHEPGRDRRAGFSPLLAVHVANRLEHELVVISRDYAINPLDELYLSASGLAPRLPVWREACLAVLEQGGAEGGI